MDFFFVAFLMIVGGVNGWCYLSDPVMRDRRMISVACEVYYFVITFYLYVFMVSRIL